MDEEKVDIAIKHAALSIASALHELSSQLPAHVSRQAVMERLVADLEENQPDSADWISAHIMDRVEEILERVMA